MLQLWKLVLLCGLLTGTSASLLGNLGDDLNNVVDKLKPVVEKGLETVDNTLESVLQKLKADWKIIQKSKAWHLAEEKVQEVKNLVNDALSKIVPAKDDTLGLNIINSRILKIKAELTLDGEGLNIRIPVVANVTLALPLIDRVVNLKVSLDLVTSVRLATNAQTGAVTVIVGKCSSDEDSISLTLIMICPPSCSGPPLLPSLTHSLSLSPSPQVCPLIHTLLSNLDGHIIQDIIGKSQPGDRGWKGAFPLQPPKTKHEPCAQPQQGWSGGSGEAGRPSI
uniref:BPI fold containing family A member 2 n=1 Tax=Canis lupus dingo TaxID=286419 RepID=A0A8C0JTG2_CANLU